MTLYANNGIEQGHHLQPDQFQRHPVDQYVGHRSELLKAYQSVRIKAERSALRFQRQSSKYNQCRMPVLRNGISLIPPGFLKRSSWNGSNLNFAGLMRNSVTCLTPTTTPSGAQYPRPQRGLMTDLTSRVCGNIVLRLTSKLKSCSRVRGTRCSGNCACTRAGAES